MTFFDGDSHTPDLKYTWSLAGYVWDNDGSNNNFTDGTVSLDPDRADLDSATGLEVSGGLRGRGITLDWQYNRIRGEAVAEGFTGGVYVGGVARLDVAAVEAGYRILRIPLDLGAALARFDTDGYVEPWDQSTLVLNLRRTVRFLGELKMSDSWISSRRGVPGEDFQETRLQIEYVW